MEIARALAGREGSKANDGVAWVKELCKSLRIPSLGSHGISSTHLSELIEDIERASSTKGDPIRMTRDEIERILTQAL